MLLAGYLPNAEDMWPGMVHGGTLLPLFSGYPGCMFGYSSGLDSVVAHAGFIFIFHGDPLKSHTGFYEKWGQ